MNEWMNWMTMWSLFRGTKDKKEKKDKSKDKKEKKDKKDKKEEETKPRGRYDTMSRIHTHIYLIIITTHSLMTHSFYPSPSPSLLEPWCPNSLWTNSPPNNKTLPLTTIQQPTTIRTHHYPHQLVHPHPLVFVTRQPLPREEWVPPSTCKVWRGQWTNDKRERPSVVGVGVVLVILVLLRMMEEKEGRTSLNKRPIKLIIEREVKWSVIVDEENIAKFFIVIDYLCVVSVW